MFTKEQIDYMHSLGFNVDFDHATDDELIEIEEVVTDRLTYAGFDEDYQPTSEGLMCESILDALADIP